MADFRSPLDRTALRLTRRVRPVRDAVTEKVPALRPYLIRRPAIMPVRKLHAHWSDPDTEIAPGPYADASVRAILAGVGGALNRSEPVLEVGSGLGATLAALADTGFTNLTGVEINPFAAQRMRATYPQLADATMLIGPAETVLQDLPDDSVSLVVAVRTLQHTHPDSVALFNAIARITTTVVTIDEPAFLGRHTYPWDLAREFTSRGFTVKGRHPLVAGGHKTRDTVLELRR